MCSRKPLPGDAMQKGATVLISGQQAFTEHVFTFGFWKKERDDWMDLESMEINM